MADLDSYQKLKRIYGIRNRFWTRPGERLRPLLDEAHRRSAILNHMVVYLALVETFRRMTAIENEEELESVFHRRLARGWNRFGRIGDMKLAEGQRAAVIEKNGLTTVILRNRDGSVDSTLRRRFLAGWDRLLRDVKEQWRQETQNNRPVAYHATVENPRKDLRSNSGEGRSPEDSPDRQDLRDRAAETIYRCLPLVESQEDPPSAPSSNQDAADLYLKEFIGSAAGRALGTYIPGLPVIVQLIRERKRLRQGRWNEVLGTVLSEGVKDSLQGVVRLILSNLRAGASVSGPVASLLGIGLDRVESLRRSISLLEKERAVLDELRPFYKGLSGTGLKTLEPVASGKDKTL